MRGVLRPPPLRRPEALFTSQRLAFGLSLLGSRLKKSTRLGCSGTQGETTQSCGNVRSGELWTLSFEQTRGSFHDGTWVLGVGFTAPHVDFGEKAAVIQGLGSSLKNILPAAWTRHDQGLLVHGSGCKLKTQNTLSPKPKLPNSRA